jgi:predicted ribosomally synthesized peptide with SipW-like signal peptide
VKKILFVLLVCLLSLGVVGGAFAYFTDTATSNANTFTAGTVHIVLGGGIAGGINFTNMAPGDKVTGSMWVQNTGSLPIWFSGYMADGWSQSLGGYIDKFSVKVTTDPTDYYGYNQIIYNGPLTGLVGKSNGLIALAGEFPPLPAGAWAGYNFEFTLDGPSTGNAYQGAWLSGTLAVDAIQSNNISWADAFAFLKNGVTPP